GLPVENWGIAAPDQVTATPTGTASGGWAANTFYSAPGVIVDLRGGHTNIWQVTTPGTTSGSIPFGTSPSVGDTQPDGGAVWTCVSNNASSTWTAHTSYVDGTYAGAYPWIGTVTIDGTIYPAGQFLPDWHTGKFVVAIA